MDRILGNERLLWWLVVTTLTLDLALTALGRHVGLVELNPFVAGLLERSGMGAFVLCKIAAVAVGVCCRRIVPDHHTALVPLGLALPWGAAALVNVLAIAAVV